MRATAARFEGANQALQRMLDSLLGELEGLRQDWQGRGGTSFAQVKQQWANDQEVLHRALAETATAIRTAGTQYTATDDAAADRFGAGLAASIPLPLEN